MAAASCLPVDCCWPVIGRMKPILTLLSCASAPPPAASARAAQVTAKKVLYFMEKTSLYRLDRIPTFRPALVQLPDVSLRSIGTMAREKPGSPLSGGQMAKIVLGLGTSHTPMLLASDETLLRFEETDQTIRHRDKEGRPATYAELLEKADPKMAAMVAPAELVARQNKARDAGAHLSKTL